MKCPIHDQTDCSPLLNGCSELAAMFRAVEQLDDISRGDPEAAHSTADMILLEYVPEEVKLAYKRAANRQDWWACA